MNGITICGFGHALPKRIVTNEDFAAVLDTSDEWIRSRTGIHSRHFCDPELGESAASLAAEAVREALEEAWKCRHISKEEIGLVIGATASSQMRMPSTASYVQEVLELPAGIPAFDINAACSGFVYALAIADSMMKSSNIRYAVIVGAEELSRVVDQNDRSTCVLFGDGAGAVVVERREGVRFAAHLGGQGDVGALYADPVLHMDGRRVFRFAVQKLEEEILSLTDEVGSRLQDIDYFVCHQANRRIIEHVQARLKLPEEKFPMNLMTTGNTSAASIPLMLYDLAHDGRLQEGQRICLVGFGAGLTWGSAYLEL